MEKKKRPVKVRRKWVRNPSEQVVPNERGAGNRPSNRELRDEAISDYEELATENERFPKTPE